MTVCDLRHDISLYHNDKMVNKIYSKYVEIGAFNIHYLKCGKGDPLIIIHGGGGEASKGWLHILKELSVYFTVYIPDLPGFGDSKTARGDFHLLEFVDFMKDFSQKLGLKRFHLLGHSMGGGIALHYALAYPSHIKKLILLNSMCLGKEIALWVRFLTSAAFYLWEAFPTFFKALGCLIRLPFNRNKSMARFPSFRVELGNSIANFKGQNVVLLNRLPELVMPTLLVWGANDRLLPAGQAQAAAELIPDCRLHIFEECGHDVHKQKVFELSRLLQSYLG